MKKWRFLSTFSALLLFTGITVSCSSDSNSSQNPCEGENCEKPCGGENCEKPCEGENCEKPCEGENCEKPCEGEDCEKPCEGENCEKPCEGEDCEKPCEGEDCEKPCEGENCNQEPPVIEEKDEGAVEEPEIQTDDSDVLEGVTLPENTPIPNDPCLACTHRQECHNNTCLDSTRHNVSVNKAFTDENGDKASFSISLTRRPTHDVTFKCWINSTSPFPEAKIECPGKIEANDWIVFQFSSRTSEQIITVTGLPDDVDDGDQKYTVMLQTVSEDPYFSDIIHSPMEFTNRNVNRAGVTWHAEETLLTGEDGRKATYTLTLNSKPMAPVKLKLRSSDITEGTVEPKTLIFKPEDWSTPQTVTVTGVDDNYRDESVQYAILTSAVSADPKYNGIEIEKVGLANLDNDMPAITLSSSAYKLSPSNSKTRVSVNLSTQPTSDVNVDIHQSFSSEAWSITPKSLVFTNENWNQPQYVDISFDHPEHTETAITTGCVYASTISDEPAQDGLLSLQICMDFYRYEPMNFGCTEKEETVRLVPGEYKLEAWGSQGGGSLNSLGGYGGYSYGRVEFKEVTNLYINVGGIPYNGGGPAQASGGGATHIATESGLLSTLESKKDSVLIVAGGGGGSERTPGGYGGGETGGIGNEYTYVTKIPTGATQTAGGERGETSMFGVGSAGTFGQGGDGIGQIDYVNNPNPHLDSGGGGGGGWYGGGGVPYAGGGGGGSGHIGKNVTGETISGSGEQSFESPTGGPEPGHAGTGYARISIIEREPPQIN